MSITYAQAVVFVPDGRVLLIKPAFEKNAQWHATLDTHVALSDSARFEILDALSEDLGIIPGQHDSTLKHEFTLTVRERILKIFSLHLRKSITLTTDEVFPLIFAAITFNRLVRWIKSEKNAFSANTQESIISLDEMVGKTLTKGCYLK